MDNIKTYVLTLNNDEEEIFKDHSSYYGYGDIEEYLKSVLLKDLINIESKRLLSNLKAAMSKVSMNKIFTIKLLIEENSIIVPDFISLLHLDERFESTFINNVPQSKIIYIDICEETFLSLYKKVR